MSFSIRSLCVKCSSLILIMNGMHACIENDHLWWNLFASIGLYFVHSIWCCYMDMICMWSCPAMEPDSSKHVISIKPLFCHFHDYTLFACVACNNNSRHAFPMCSIIICFAVARLRFSHLKSLENAFVHVMEFPIWFGVRTTFVGLVARSHNGMLYAHTACRRAPRTLHA